MVTPRWQGNSNSLSSLRLPGYCSLVWAKKIALLWAWQKQFEICPCAQITSLYFVTIVQTDNDDTTSVWTASFLLASSISRRNWKKGQHRPFNTQIPERQSLVGNDVSVKHVSPRVRVALLCFHRQFISSEVIRALRISAHQIQLMDGINPGAGPRNDR